jgi:hypothetical protein
MKQATSRTNASYATRLAVHHQPHSGPRCGWIPGLREAIRIADDSAALGTPVEGAERGTLNWRPCSVANGAANQLQAWLDQMEPDQTDPDQTEPDQIEPVHRLAVQRLAVQRLADRVPPSPPEAAV